MAVELTLELDREVARELDRARLKSGQSQDAFVREALRRRIGRTEIEELRAELRPYAEAVGWLTDEDVFRSVS